MADTRSTIDRKRGSARAVCTIACTPEELQAAETAALEKLAAHVNLPGFRPGKAPADLVRQKVKEDALLEETIRELLPKLLPVILQEQKLNPIIPPKVAVAKREPLTLAFTFVEKPAVTVKGGAKLKVEKKETKVDPAEVEQVIGSVLEDHRMTAPVERASAMGDQITMDFKGTTPEGQEIPGLQAKGETVVLGKNSLIPGFEEHLTGLKPGESKSFTLTLPATLPVESLKNKPVLFHVTVSKVEAVTLPELTDAFVKDTLKLESVAALRKQIEESIKTREEQMETARREQAVLDAVRDATQADLPEELIDEESRMILEEMEERLSRQGRSLKDWMEGKDPKVISEELKKSAGDRLKMRFGLEQLLIDRKIELSDDEMKAAIDAYIRRLPPEQRKTAEVGKDSAAYAQIHWQQRLDKLFKELLA